MGIQTYQTHSFLSPFSHSLFQSFNYSTIQGSLIHSVINLSVKTSSLFLYSTFLGRLPSFPIFPELKLGKPPNKPTHSYRSSKLDVFSVVLFLKPENNKFCFSFLIPQHFINNFKGSYRILLSSLYFSRNHFQKNVISCLILIKLSKCSSVLSIDVNCPYGRLLNFYQEQPS